MQDSQSLLQPPAVTQMCLAQMFSAQRCFFAPRLMGQHRGADLGP